MRLPVIFPLLCYLVAMVLAFLLLFSGHEKGFMEDYAIVRLNTSSLGYNLVDNTFNFGSDDTDSNDQQDSNGHGSLVDNIVDGVTDKADGIKDSVQGILNDAGNKVAELLARDLGISEWYSIHIMTGCQGDFSPNATVPDAGLNTTNCSGGSIGYRINITELLDHELSVGPANINLADLGFPPEVSKQINTVNHVLKAVAILFVLAVVFTGIGMLLSAATLIADKTPPRKLFAVLNLLVAILATIVLLACSLIATIGARKAAAKINEYGARAGLVATSGERFITLSWVAFALGAAAGLFSLFDLFGAIMGRKKSVNEKWYGA